MIETWLDFNFPKVLNASGGQDKRIDCPFCEARHGSPDTKQHMYVNLTHAAVHCFRCDWSGNQIDLVMSVTGCSYLEALIEVSQPTQHVGLFQRITASPKGLMHVDAAKPDGFMTLYEPAIEGSAECKAILNYLRQRKVPERLIRQRFGVVPGTHRAWIIIDYRYWQGRSIIKSVEPRYVNPPWEKADALWNWQALGKAEEIVICEGVFSALAVGDHALALLGKSATEQQVARIVRHQPRQICLMLDKGAEAEAMRLAEQFVMAGYRNALKLHWLEYAQPDDGLTGVTEDWSYALQVRQRLSNAV